MRILKMFNGNEVSVPDKLERIVSFSPAVTEILFDLGLGDKIVADSAFCSRPEGARYKRKLASYSTTRKDILKELNPDIILTIGGYQEILYNNLKGDLPVYIFELPSSLSGLLDLISKVGIVVNKKVEARNLDLKLIKQYKNINTDIFFKTYFEMDLGGPVTFGSMSYITDALYVMGFDTIYANFDREWITPDLDFVARADPDVIIYEHKMYREFDYSDMERLILKRKWNNISAVKNGNVFITPGRLDFFAHHGPSFFTEVIPWTINIYNNIKSKIKN
ncbi:ABC transporter substrate-binding protein [Acidiplasma sp.]|uniref:ABC transporter substrate-binding protein n=1 Tax=Acidiplasma sp. TaxID=1872114 RepID=UPI00258E79C6|nr:ABC transporter substrate-binding protein [Acidiplasma sp.]